MYVLGIHGVGSCCRRHAQRQPLPLHAAIEGAVGAADDPVRRQEQRRADGVGKRRHQRRPALEAGQGVLLDRQRMQLRPQPMRLPLPLLLARRIRPAKCGSQNAMWHTRPMPKTVTSLAPCFFRSAICSA